MIIAKSLHRRCKMAVNRNEKMESPEQKRAKRLAVCNACETRTFKDGMLVCKDVRKKTADMLACPRKRW